MNITFNSNKSSNCTIKLFDPNMKLFGTISFLGMGTIFWIVGLLGNGFLFYLMFKLRIQKFISSYHYLLWLTCLNFMSTCLFLIYPITFFYFKFYEIPMIKDYIWHRIVIWIIFSTTITVKTADSIILALSCDRYLAIVFPIFYLTYINKNRIIAFLWFSLIFHTLFSILAFFVDSVHATNCDNLLEYKLFPYTNFASSLTYEFILQIRKFMNVMYVSLIAYFTIHTLIVLYKRQFIRYSTFLRLNSINLKMMSTMDEGIKRNESQKTISSLRIDIESETGNLLTSKPVNILTIARRRYLQHKNNYHKIVKSLISIIIFNLVMYIPQTILIELSKEKGMFYSNFSPMMIIIHLFSMAHMCLSSFICLLFNKNIQRMLITNIYKK
ncbi:unnamed protein product [Gordionus sp. m RMFG-2023]